MTSCYEMANEEEGDEDKLEKSSENEVRALTIPEAFPIASMHRLETNPQLARRSTSAYCSLQHLKLYADKVKDVSPSMKDSAQYAPCNTTITFF